MAMRSKGHWGYDPEFLEACRAELTMTAEKIGGGEVYVLEAGGRLLGYYALRPREGELMLDDLFVDPPAIGRGAGRQLWRHAVERAAALGFERILIEADPNAEAFYRKAGAERIGEAPSGSIPGRLLPLLCFEIGDGSA